MVQKAPHLLSWYVFNNNIINSQNLLIIPAVQCLDVNTDLDLQQIVEKLSGFSYCVCSSDGTSIAVVAIKTFFQGLYISKAKSKALNISLPTAMVEMLHSSFGFSWTTSSLSYLDVHLTASYSTFYQANYPKRFTCFPLGKNIPSHGLVELQL